MRSDSSYRSSRRNKRREDRRQTGETWPEFQARYWGARGQALAKMEAQAMKLTPEQARMALARWATSPQNDLVSVTELLTEGKQNASAEEIQSAAFEVARAG